jgi:nitroimidazol reductase NimA-like FMN-containing flavoprotein (pyridoxamine 5'-phosphate oxidase superfamily)
VTATTRPAVGARAARYDRRVSDPLERTERTRVRRKPERGAYDATTIEAILDEALYCHVATVDDLGRPRAIPTIHVRLGDTVYIHGSTGSRTLRGVRDGQEVCLVATLLDGLVFARSAAHHSMNYRSVVLYGLAREVRDPDEKWRAQAALVEHVCAGRSEQARMPNAKELAETMILAIPLREASAKVRTGPPIDEDEDVPLPIWAGVLPLRTIAEAPQDAPDLPAGIPVPPNVQRYERPAPSPGRRT